MNIHSPFQALPRVRENSALAVPGAVEFAIQQLGFEPDEKQAAVLASNSKRGILLCSRQWGKSTVSAVKAVHRAATVAGSLVLVASPTERQSGEWVRKAEEFVRRLGWKPKGDGANAQSIVFANGSRIGGLPGNEATVRGFSAVSLLLIDEAARVPDDLYRALRPMLAVAPSSTAHNGGPSGHLCAPGSNAHNGDPGGDLWLMSTPFGKRGFFYEEWADGPGWERVTGPATECARISAEFLEEERRAQGEKSFAQEFLCEFTDNGQTMFPRDLVESVMRDDVEPLF